MDHDESLRSSEWAAPISPFMRLPDVLQATGLARSTVYRMVAEHTFPAPVKLAKRAVGWRHDDVRQWAAARPSTWAR
jgi:prophage regulatory protein